MKVHFYLRFHTKFGESLYITGNLPRQGETDNGAPLPLSFLNDELWHGSFEVNKDEVEKLNYRYEFKNIEGEWIKDAEKERVVNLKKSDGDVVVVDTWNDESFYENAFFTTPFTEVFLKTKKNSKVKKTNGYSHIFKVKAPLLPGSQCICISGNQHALGNWETANPILLQKEGNWWQASIDLKDVDSPVIYKYAVYDSEKEEFIKFEDGANRILLPAPDKKFICHDGFVRLSDTKWKGSGIAIPVFSLRTNNSFGVGEFSDIKLLVDWAEKTGLKLIQILPINDTSATFTWRDSYPYAAISAFALHPLYINLQRVAAKKHGQMMKALVKKQKQLNALKEIDYEKVMQFKQNVLRELYELDDLQFMNEQSFKNFFEDNKNWLVSYAAFSFLRDRYCTSDYSKWKTHSVYNSEEIEKLTSSRSKHFKSIAFYYFVQYHLHLQLKEAVDYAHKRGIALKGDIPIGIYRYGCDAWTAPELYNMDMQAGAPPDDFTIKGQNWGFPTYNWKKMEEDNFEWWRQRFHQMSNYFDAFRIDHILGFFRIWSIPIDEIEGVMGRFIPAIPVSMTEFGERGIWFDYDRFCMPYITDGILDENFGTQAEFVKDNFLQPNKSGRYDLKEAFNTQRKVENYFALQDPSEENNRIRQGLFDLITNVLLFEHQGSGKQQFHFRILIDHTSSFRELDDATKHKLNDLYINYFYRRQDGFWKQEAMHKLPALKDATNMLICGEDLGMVPHSVPEVMKQLGILSLEIQRMPKNPQTEFFNPKDAPYLSVITPSSHDMSTIRGWWEESREKTQRFYNDILGEQGTAPYFCEPWINRAIILQHLYAPSMWSIFQLQDILGMSEQLRREDPAEERINDPANSEHYWNYRMHLSLEQLLKEKEFNSEFHDYIKNSGRA
jgi:4-alpha-glucanotransferase